MSNTLVPIPSEVLSQLKKSGLVSIFQTFPFGWTVLVHREALAHISAKTSCEVLEGLRRKSKALTEKTRGRKHASLPFLSQQKPRKPGANNTQPLKFVTCVGVFVAKAKYDGRSYCSHKKGKMPRPLSLCDFAARFRAFCLCVNNTQPDKQAVTLILRNCASVSLNIWQNATSSSEWQSLENAEKSTFLQTF